VACAAPAASAARSSQQPAPLSNEIVDFAKTSARAFGLLGLFALLAALVATRRRPAGFHGHAGGFGGRASGWEASPSLVLLASSAVFFLLAAAVVLQLMSQPSAKGG
jgi:hypothetical protein